MKKIGKFTIQRVQELCLRFNNDCKQLLNYLHCLQLQKKYHSVQQVKEQYYSSQVLEKLNLKLLQKRYSTYAKEILIDLASRLPFKCDQLNENEMNTLLSLEEKQKSKCEDLKARLKNYKMKIQHGIGKKSELDIFLNKLQSHEQNKTIPAKINNSFKIINSITSQQILATISLSVIKT